MTISRSAADGGGPPSGGGRRRDGVPRRGVAPPCGEAVLVRGRRRRRTGLAGRLGCVTGPAPLGPGGGGLCACWTAWRGTGSGPPRQEGWGTRQDPLVLGLSLRNRPRAYTVIVGMNVSLCILNQHSCLHFRHARRLIQLCQSPPLVVIDVLLFFVGPSSLLSKLLGLQRGETRCFVLFHQVRRDATPLGIG